MRANQDKNELPRPSVKDSRVLVYLGVDNDVDLYQNTEEENILVNLWNTKYILAKNEYEASRCNTKNVTKWRKAYLGDFKRLDEFGEETTEKMKAIRKMVFELVESKISANVPGPKMTPRYHSDLQPVRATESLIKHEIDKMVSEETHDEAEHSALIDSTTWLKVSWNPFDNTHERSGMPLVENCPVDTVFPQPGIANYKELEYTFERKRISLSKILDLYNRRVNPVDGTDLVDIVECHYLNKDRHVGKFVFVESTLTVLCNDLEWGMRRRRECTECSRVVLTEAVCPQCGSESFKFVGVKKQKLTKPLVFITNPYRSSESTEPSDDQTKIDDNLTVPEGTEIPHYLIRQLPYVPMRTIKVAKEIYGISEVQLHLEPQDSVNTFLNNAEEKSKESKTYATKLKDTRVDSEGKRITWIEVESAQEGAAIQVKQVQSDIAQELTMASYLYDASKSTAGVTDTDQGKADPTARSGKAKQLQMMASQQRDTAPQKQRNAAYAGVYELIFKYLLAYSDEERSFVSLQPDGSTKEELWSKYMFLSKDDDGNFYYRDDFAWSVDEASNITQDRAAMWQLIDNDFMNGTMGTELDPQRALKMYWNMKDQAGYPTAKFALAFLENAVQHLPTQTEQALLNNPEAVELALSFIADMQKGGSTGGAGGQGGARDGAGRSSSGQTKGQQQGKANNESRAAEGQQTNTAAVTTGGMQGGTK